MSARHLSLFVLIVLSVLTIHGCSHGGPVDTTALGHEVVDSARSRAPSGPINLRTRDGVNLRLVSLDVRGFVQEPLAFTELHMEFDNPESQPLDAQLEMVLPARAQVTRFATVTGEAWREAEVVERAMGDPQPSLFEVSDPAVSRDQGNIFRAKIPKIPSRARQKVILSYTEDLLDVTRPYLVRLEGLPEIDRFEARVVVAAPPESGEQVAALRGPRPPAHLPDPEVVDGELTQLRHHFRPTTDLRIAASPQRHTGIRSGRTVISRIKPLTHDHAEPIRSLTVLFDTSASRAHGFESKVARLEALLDEVRARVGDPARVRLIAFDQSYDIVFEGRIGDLSDEHYEMIRARRPLGASDLSRVLNFAAAGRGERLERVLLFSDGVVTAGRQDEAALVSVVRRLENAGVRRFDVIVDEGTRPSPLMTTLATTLPQRGLVLESAGEPRRMARKLGRTVMSNVEIDVPGARWFYPDRVDGLQSGDEILVYADIDPADEIGISVTGDDIIDHYEVELLEVERGLVDRARGRAEVDYLIAALERAHGQPKLYKQQFWRQIVSKSKRHRILNEYTTLRMMADEHDYSRAAVDPSALVPVLAAGPRAIERRGRGLPNALGVQAGEVHLSAELLPSFPEEKLGTHELLLLSENSPDPAPVGEIDGVELAESDDGLESGDALVRQEQALLDELHSEVQLQLDSATNDSVRRAREMPNKAKIGQVSAPRRSPEDAYSGNLLAVMNLLRWGKTKEATQVAWAWREADPSEVMALVALGEALEAGDDPRQASRAYGSIIDLYPRRADMRRFAGAHLEAVERHGQRLAIDTYQRAREQRPEHPSSHRLLAFALLRAGYDRSAFDVLAESLERSWGRSRFAGVEKVLLEDISLVGASWIKSDPEAKHEIMARLRRFGTKPADEPSLRFVLTWETGANDVDLHVRDGFGSHAFYKSRALGSGGVLYYDASDGYGPEVFAVSGEPTGYPYNLQVHYYATGPMGFGMGKVQVIQHDGAGSVDLDERPFVVMKDRAYLDLGVVEAPSGR